MLTTVEGLYTSPDGGELVPELRRIDERIRALARDSDDLELCTGGMQTKLKAAEMAAQAGVATVIASGTEPDILRRICRGDQVGTYVHARADAVRKQKRWIVSLRAKGTIVVDEGAAHALQQLCKSLLPSGVVAVTGNFKRGDAVEVVSSGQQPFAKGITNYSAQELMRIKGHKTTEIEKILGFKYFDEVIHRDKLVCHERQDREQDNGT